ncbi:MAG: type I 3-dehydroquinate dehydratase [Acidobacteria bacterium]|nr:type I 3-dehydroquinate dehydratase [Acidobacteriota bacterium]
MNNGKICVSVCAETRKELVKQIQQAAIYADIIELRFDCLDRNIIRKVMENILKIDKRFLITFRPKEQGGKRELNLRERLKFWEFFFWNNKAENLYADLEFDLQLILKLDSKKIIVSSHDFSGLSDNLTGTYEILNTVNSDLQDKFPRKI